jgi:hypothetical protein
VTETAAIILLYLQEEGTCRIIEIERVVKIMGIDAGYAFLGDIRE